MEEVYVVVSAECPQCLAYQAKRFGLGLGDMNRHGAEKSDRYHYGIHQMTTPLNLVYPTLGRRHTSMDQSLPRNL